MKKRILCIALVLSFLLSVLPIGAAAQEETAEETLDDLFGEASQDVPEEEKNRVLAELGDNETV